MFPSGRRPCGSGWVSRVTSRLCAGCCFINTARSACSQRRVGYVFSHTPRIATVTRFLLRIWAKTSVMLFKTTTKDSYEIVFSFSSHVKSFLDVGGVCFKFCPHSLAVDALQPLCSTSLLLTQKKFDFYKEAMLERLNSLISHQNHQNFLVRKFSRTTWRLELLRFRRKTVQLLNHHRYLPD